MNERKQERCLWLTQEEAMGLLDIAVLGIGELSPDQRAAIGKLSDFCRQFLREECEAAPAATLSRTGAVSVSVPYAA
ncbi:MAG TPA: hypothetical protein VFB38_23840 [Chthonomonadaceae bacterium]|nr:hypothetical protein [Chthonomonadaceae bacterium]